jgi:AAHS family 4-hydroxybenzoate transporter-like MFS transporter
MADTSASVDVRRFIDERPFGRYQRWLIAQCTLLCMIDGFDVQAIAFVAPVLAQDWGIAASTFGPVFGAGLFGLTIGALVAGPLADRIGRRPSLLLCVAIFGVFSLLTPLAQDTTGLSLLRFATGIGLGGAMPNIITLTSEYAPERLRATMVTLTFCGFPLGAVIGGLLSTALMPRFGWEAVFIMGGVLPLLVGAWLWRNLPESARFLVARGRPAAQIREVLVAIDPSAQLSSVSRFHLGEGIGTVQGMPLSRLFSEGRARSTLLLWVAFFMNLLALYFLVNWLPMLFQRAGLSIERAIFATIVMNIGGIVGGLVLGPAIDRFGARRVLISTSLSAALLVAATGLFGGVPAVLITLVFLVGICVVGGQMGLNAQAASVYPTPMRATGVGWALGIGRIGSVVGPIAGGILIAAETSLRDILLICAAAPFIAALALAALRPPSEARAS